MKMSGYATDYDNDEGQYDEWLEGKLIIDDIIEKTKLEKNMMVYTCQKMVD